MARSFDTPTAAHPLGTDHLGRDIAARMLSGNSSLVIPPAIAAVTASIVGILLAISSAISAHARTVIRFLGDALLAVPAILILLATVTAISESFSAAALAAIVLSVPMSTRYFYPTVVTTLRSGYVEYARATGTRWRSIALQEILPALRRPIIADLSIRFVAVVFLTATTNFLSGAGGGADSTWAAMVGSELSGIDLNPWAVVAPTMAIIALTACPVLLIEIWLGGRR